MYNTRQNTKYIIRRSKQPAIIRVTRKQLEEIVIGLICAIALAALWIGAWLY